MPAEVCSPHGLFFTFREEGTALLGVLADAVSGVWEGRECVKEMRRAEYSQWAQDEWAAFYFEYKGLPALINAFVGLFSERDYARKLALRGLRSRETPVSVVMSSPVITISPDASVQEGMQIMTQLFVRHLPVVDGAGNVLGMVSIGDLVKAVIQDQAQLIEQLERLHRALSGARR